MRGVIIFSFLLFFIPAVELYNFPLESLLEIHIIFVCLNSISTETRRVNITLHVNRKDVIFWWEFPFFPAEQKIKRKEWMIRNEIKETRESMEYSCALSWLRQRAVEQRLFRNFSDRLTFTRSCSLSLSFSTPTSHVRHHVSNVISGIASTPRQVVPSGICVSQAPRN